MIIHPIISKLSMLVILKQVQTSTPYKLWTSDNIVEIIKKQLQN
jgi:hypothetical protein